jgi:hypothetical protein
MAPILPAAVGSPANIDVNVEGSVFSQHDGRQSDPYL